MQRTTITLLKKDLSYPILRKKYLPMEIFRIFMKLSLRMLNPLAKEEKGDFLGAHDTFFYLWKAGNYRWYLEDWEANVFPGNQIIYRKDGSTVIEWEDGKRKFVAKDGTSVMFWSPINKGYFDAKGNPLP